MANADAMNSSAVSVSSTGTSSGDEAPAGGATKVVAPPKSVQVPTSAVPSPLTTKSKSNSSGKASVSSKPTKPLTVTVNGNDRSKDLNEHDVVCEKGRGDHERWPGNKLYRHLINVNKDTYNDLAPIERSNIIGKIIGTIQEKDGWFVHHSEATGNWAKLTEEKVRKKVSDDLRREVRRRREKRSHNSLFSAKLRAIKEMEEVEAVARDILERVDDPRQADVLFGPGARRHPGNKTYWHHMKLNLDQYIISPYGARSVISRNIVQIIRSQHGRFLEQDPKTGIWYSISDKRAVEKTSHALSNMKYKTRKRHPDEPPLPPSNLFAHHHVVPHGFIPPPHMLPHHHHHRLAYRGVPYAEEAVYDDEITLDQEKIMEGDSPNTIFAKKRTKKFRLLNRMDDVMPGVEQTPLKGKDSNANVRNSDPTGSAQKNSIVSNNTVTVSKTTDRNDPTTTPNPGSGKIISPNSSRSSEASSDEYQEQRNPNAYRRVHHIHATGMPPMADIDYSNAAGGSYHLHAGAGDIAPRLSHFDYIKSYGMPPVPPGLHAGPGAAFKTLSYAAGMRGDEYAPSHHAVAPGVHHAYMRRYLAPSLAAVAAQAHSGGALPPGTEAPSLNTHRWGAAAAAASAVGAPEYY
eukprot:CAMPEP_0197183584 /NCGR_PEP_ID=MMETSP1423-20130617/7896_1 /TAXON_ID=476441 /ORGANISM="Pseudo-nitzschia heimii, Strain UNC1101" /LENGTH=630 /DNA_ID=CAMNT_0042634173 /DNA_START=101 /DNA_END=1993 /DNA_ORIENTATION=+